MQGRWWTEEIAGGGEGQGPEQGAEHVVGGEGPVVHGADAWRNIYIYIYIYIYISL